MISSHFPLSCLSKALTTKKMGEGRKEGDLHAQRWILDEFCKYWPFSAFFLLEN